MGRIQLRKLTALILPRCPHRCTDSNAYGDTRANIAHSYSDSYSNCRTNRYSCANGIQFDCLLGVISSHNNSINLTGSYAK